MSFMGKLMKYLDINVATLSGAIDIIVVKRKDGTYRSTPFHVRFGKLQLLRSREKYVRVKINDQPTNLLMKVGEAGEVFFVEETSEEVASPLATSPLNSPPNTGLESTVMLSESSSTTTEPAPAAGLLLQETGTNYNELAAGNRPAEELEFDSHDEDIVIHLHEEDVPQQQQQQQPSLLEPSTNPVRSRSGSVTKSVRSHRRTHSGGSFGRIMHRASSKGLLEEDGAMSDPETFGVNQDAALTYNMPDSPRSVDKTITDESSYHIQWGWGQIPVVTADDQPAGDLPSEPSTDTELANVDATQTEQRGWKSFWRLFSHDHNSSSKPVGPGSAGAASLKNNAYSYNDLLTLEAMAEAQEQVQKEHQELYNREVEERGDATLSAPDSPNISVSAAEATTAEPKTPQPAVADSSTTPAHTQQTPANSQPAPSQETPATEVKQPPKRSFFSKWFGRSNDTQDESSKVETLSSSTATASTTGLAVVTNLATTTSSTLSTSNSAAAHDPLLSPKSNSSSELELRRSNNSFCSALLPVNGKYEISICAHLLDGVTDVNRRNKLFDANKLKFEDFLENPNILYATDAIYRIGDNYYPWHVGLPLMTSMSLFGEETFPEAHRVLAHPSSALHATPRSSAPNSSYPLYVPADDVSDDHDADLVTEYATATEEKEQKPSGGSWLGRLFRRSAPTVSASSLPTVSLSSSSSSSSTSSTATATTSTIAGSAVETAATSSAASSPSKPVAAVASASTTTTTTTTQSTTVPTGSSSTTNSQIGSPSKSKSNAATSNTTTTASTAAVVTVSETESPKLDGPPMSVSPTRSPLRPHARSRSVDTVGSGSGSDSQQSQTSNRSDRSPSYNNNHQSSSPTTSVASSLIHEHVPEEYHNFPPSDVPLHPKFTKKSLRPTPAQLATLDLHPGANTVEFTVTSRLQGSQSVFCTLYLYEENTKIVISDIDGTITRSDVLGQFLPILGRDWSRAGVAKLYSNIAENGYQMIYLTARAIGQSRLTRNYIQKLQQDGQALPIGPVMMAPDSLFQALNREVIQRRPHEFKISCLRDIRMLWPPSHQPFYAGFGNRESDLISYRAVGVPEGRTFIILDNDLIKSVSGNEWHSYNGVNEIVYEVFPSILQKRHIAEESFNELNFFRPTLPLLDEEEAEAKPTTRTAAAATATTTGTATTTMVSAAAAAAAVTTTTTTTKSTATANPSTR